MSDHAATYPASRIKRHRRTRAEIEAIHAAIVDVLAADHPMTVRGVFYRLVAASVVEKTENAYDRVGEYLLTLRRGGQVPYGWIADNTRWMRKPHTYASLSDALTATARAYRQALWDDQDAYVEIVVEKDGLAGVLMEETDPFDVPLMACRGFSSETYLFEAAQAIRHAARPAYIYLLTNHDPSGVAIAADVERKLRGFLPEAEVHAERVAVTEEQIRRWDLPTRPTKATDSRARGFGGDSVELDAIPAGELRALVRECIVRHIDPDAWARTQAIERLERATLESVALLDVAPGTVLRLTGPAE